MKKSLAIVSICAGLAISLIVTGCSNPSNSSDSTVPAGVAVRLITFASDLSSNRTNVYKNFTVGTSAYSAGAPATYWDTNFPAGTYTLGGITAWTPTTYTAVLSGPSPFNAGPVLTFKLAVDSSGSYTISEIDKSGVTYVANAVILK